MDKSIFREYDIRGTYPEQINDNDAKIIAYLFAKKYKLKKVVIALDKRSESLPIYHGAIDGFSSAGCQISTLGVDSTPSLSFAVGVGDFDGGIMVTASHNPSGYAGMKLFVRGGKLIGMSTGLDKILSQALRTKSVPKATRKQVKEISVLQDYHNFVFKIIDVSKIKNLKLVLDASSGSSAKAVEYFFLRIPGRTIKMNFRKDKFKDHGLNPLLPENRKYIESEVRKSKSDLGIIWDGDGDRAIFIDEKGKFIEPYYINCFLAKLFLSKMKEMKIKNKKIAIDSRLGLAMKQVTEENGGEPCSIRSGYSNIVRAMIEKKIYFGCENSGHFFVNALFAGKINAACAEGIIPAVLIIEYLSETGIKFSKAISEFEKMYQI